VAYANVAPDDQVLEPERSVEPIDPRFLRQEVAYNGTEAAGTVVVDTANHFLHLVGPGGRALRYGIGVARPGYSWSGRHAVSAKKEWPDWIPPEEMLKRQPYLPHCLSPAVRTIHWGRAHFILAQASIVSTARMSAGQSARTYRQDASACAMRTSLIFMSA